MLFRKKINRCCGLCIHGTATQDDRILCAKKGEREYTDKCMRFSYDPCKRVPAKAKALDCSQYEQYDFSL